MSKNSLVKSEISRMWGNTPVVDATHDMRVIIKPCDVRKAKRKDPTSCVFAQACKRSLGSKKVLFLRSVAYVEIPSSKGEMRVERFMLPREMKDLIANFDKGKDVIPQAGFLMNAPKPHDTLEQMREVTAKHRALAKSNRKKLVSKAKRAFAKQPKSVAKAVNVEVRNGNGQIHFAAKAG